MAIDIFGTIKQKFQRNNMQKAEPEGGKKKTKSDSVQSKDFDIDHEIIYMFFRSDPIINACVSVTVDNVCADGYDLEYDDNDPEAVRQYEEINEFFKKNHMDDQIRNIAAQITVFDDALQEITFNSQFRPDKSFILATQEFKPKEEKGSGELISWIQVQEGRVVAEIPKEYVIHYRLNSFGDRRMGLSLVEPVLFSASYKKFAERFTSSAFENHKPRGWWNFPEKMDDDVYDDIVDTIIEAKETPNKDLYLRVPEGVQFNPLIQKEDMHYVEFLSYLRQQIITAMLVPPILLGIPEGSNRANADVQMQTWDRRIMSIQKAIEYRMNNILLNQMFGYDKVKFTINRVNKRDTLRDVEIANKMEGYLTLNEIRESLGYSELDPAEFPEADKIMQKKPQPSNFNDLLNMREKSVKKNIKNSNFQKSSDGKDGETFPEQSPISEKDERELSILITGWISEVQRKINAEVRANKEDFQKAIPDPQKLAEKIMSLLIVEQLRDNIQDSVRRSYLKGVESVEKETQTTFQVDTEVLNFIQQYTFDLIKNLSESMENSLSSTLRRTLLEGKGIPQITKEVQQALEIEKNRARTIARTEVNRASNIGRFSAYKQAGIKKKMYIAAVDSRTSEICRNLNGQIVDLEKPFKTSVKGKQIIIDTPPAHPNCRSTFISADDDLKKILHQKNCNCNH